MNLFESMDEFKPYVFCVTDNGGETADRFTIVFTDGDYFNSSCNPTAPQGVGMHGDGSAPGVDVLGSIEERVLAGEERYIRWIDLPEAVRKIFPGTLNIGWEYWLSHDADCKDSRDEADTFEGLSDQIGRGLYRTADGRFAIKDENSQDDPNEDPTFDTIREAVLWTLPEEHSLSGLEYHSPVDLWDETGGPVPLWDRETDPPVPVDDTADGVHTHKPE
ncbi:hypothetical protein vBCbaSRXM_6 [Citromicrobium phage vB_CbaS-RXM]|nr:hypothetical protein vBCbaSRXM_6 [Citromicrobium phage vB_CbaS-RXM]